MEPRNVRASIGTAIALGLVRGRAAVPPRTAYLLTYHEGRCSSNCAFCPQASGASSKTDRLSRVLWPAFPTEEVLSRLAAIGEKGGFGRICLQVVNYEGAFEDSLKLITHIRRYSSLPISISCQPLSRDRLRGLKAAGVERVGIPLDAASEELFERVKGRSAGGPYRWEEHFRSLKDAVSIFGKGMVTTHLIVGLGERDVDLCKIIQELSDSGISTALFAFSPVEGTALEGLAPPSLARYRRIQLARHLIANGLSRFEWMEFDEGGRITGFGIPPHRILEEIGSGEPFETSGCPSCNRPFYTERAKGPLYNFPRPLQEDELEEAKALAIGSPRVGE
ncbi:MAG: radical SAM protein [Candidatus Bathyarchaeia archaeon]